MSYQPDGQAREQVVLLNHITSLIESSVKRPFPDKCHALLQQNLARATAHDEAHGAFMTLAPYTRIGEGEVHLYQWHGMT